MKEGIWKPLDDLTLDVTISPRGSVDPAWVEHLMESLDELPPVLVIDTGKELLLADGFHRYEANAKAGREAIACKIKKGDYDVARDLAATENTRHGKPLTSEERREAIRDYAKRHPGASQAAIGQVFGVGEKTVRDVVLIRTRPNALPFSQERELARADLPQQTEQKIRTQAREKDWSHREVRAAAETVKSEKVPPAYKEKMLKGEEPPVTFAKSGEPAFTAEQVLRGASEVIERDIQIKADRALEAIDMLATVDARELVNSMDGGESRSMRTGLLSLDHWMHEVLDLLAQKLEITEDVR